MSKRLFIAVISLYTALVLCLLSLALTNNVSDSVTKRVNEIETSILNEDIDSAITISENLISTWERQYTVLSTYISHESLERSEIAINSIVKYLYVGDNVSALIMCEEVKVCVKHLLDSEKPNFGNIF